MKGGSDCATHAEPVLEGGKKASKKKAPKKKNNLAEYNKSLNAAIEKNSKDKKVKSMKDVRDLAKKEFDKISKEDRKGKGVADRKSTRLNSSHSQQSRMPSSA